MDQARRELERSEDPADQAALLRARWRAGELDPWRVELAAYAGEVEFEGLRYELRCDGEQATLRAR